MKYTPPLGSLEDDAPYVDGNPSAGIRGSVVPAAPFNQLQRELVHVISASGLEPSDSDMTQVWQALQKLFSISDAEKWRKNMIGSLVPMTVSTLPAGFGKPDGSLFLFEDYPELKEKYDAGGFNGMLLEANASAEDKAAWAGKWVKHPQGLGLYAPRLQGLFLRNGGGMAGELGAYQQDAVQTGISSIRSRKYNGTDGALVISTQIYGNVSAATEVDAGYYAIAGSNVVASRLQQTVNQRTANETRPSNVSLSFGIYLGRTA